MIKQAKDLVEGDLVYIPHAKQCCQVDVVNLTNIKCNSVAIWFKRHAHPVLVYPYRLFNVPSQSIVGLLKDRISKESYDIYLRTERNYDS